MIFGIPLLLVFAFSVLNIIYMYFAQYDLYDGFVPEPSIIKLLFAYFAWAMMSKALKTYVIDREDFGFKSVLIHGPMLGFFIYFLINISLMALEPDWDYNMMLSDTLWGTGLFGAVTLFALMFKQYL